MRHSTRAGGDAPGAADGRGSANSADGGSPGGDQQAAAGAAPLQDGDPRFRVLSEQVLHRRYLTLYNRSVQFPEGPVLEYDVVGHPQADFKFAVVFPYHSADGGRWGVGGRCEARRASFACARGRQGARQGLTCCPVAPCTTHTA